MNSTNNPKVTVKRVVNADRERVFDAWSIPALMQQWLFPAGRAKTSNEFRVGGTYSHDMIMRKDKATCNPDGGTLSANGEITYPHKGEYLEIVRPERIVFTWNSVAVTNTKVTIDLREVDHGTEVTITHELLPNEEQRKSHSEGWTGCLANLAAFVG